MLHFETRDGSSPNEKSWVFLCALPEGAPAQLAAIREDIFQFCNCAIWYDDGVDTPPDELENAIAQSAMAVLPVTGSLLEAESVIQMQILPLLQSHRVSILPVLDDPNLLDMFNLRFRNIQVLDKHNTDKTAIPYEEKLKRFLDTMLLGDAMADRVRGTFRGQLFLSYRKKDRALALDMMKQIRKHPRCRAIKLWYDEFLTPGEEFNGNIFNAIRESDLFLLALTQNMVKEDNYVIRDEYPRAQREEKEILPVVLEQVDNGLVQDRFPCIPPLMDSAQAAEKLAQRMGEGAENTPEQDYLLGLAYLHGLYVERQTRLGLEQLEKSAQRGYAPAALQLANIQILEDDAQVQRQHKLCWLRKYAELSAKEYQQNPNAETAQQYADALDRAAEAEFEQRPEAAFYLYEQAVRVLEHHGCLAQSAQVCSNYGLKLVDAGKNQDGLQMLTKALRQYSQQYKADPEWAKTHTAQFSYCYYNVGNAAVQAGELKLAKLMYTSAINNFSILAREKPEEYTLVLAQAYGNLGNVYRRMWRASADPEECTQAEAHHGKAIEILNEVIEWDPRVYEPAFALELVSLAAVYLQNPDSDRGRTKILLDHAIKILQAYEQMYPGQHLYQLANAQGNRAVLFLAEGDPESARKDFDSIITIFRMLPHRQLELARAMWNMANTYAMEKKYVQARQYYEEAAAIYESGAVQGSERNPDYAQCCYNLAYCLCNSRNYPESLTWADRAAAVYRSLQGGAGEVYASRIRELQRLAEWLKSVI
ncbi:MAG: tetratricopeptide repeat protein [Oscillospiraceae bacterium]|nr:tetratricopeptide repeat protein [Oscillospiraceae bacterium]